MSERRQPNLEDEWGCQFYGVAMTATGDIWWYEEEGRRIALKGGQPRTKAEIE